MITADMGVLSVLSKIKQYINNKYRDTLHFHLNVEISAQCNLNCEICGFQRYYHPKGLMSMETFSKLGDTFKKVNSVLFGFNAETLMNPHTVEMLIFAKKANPQLCVSILTNGTLLTPGLSEQLVRNGLDDLSISIDAATKQTHEKIRRGSNFDQLIRNIQELNKAKERQGTDKPHLSTNFVGTKNNINELLAFIDLAKELKIGSIRLTNVEPYDSKVQDSVLYGENYTEEIKNIIKEAKAKCERLGISFFKPEYIKDSSCRCEFMQPIITYEGEVIPCSQFTYARDSYYYGKKVFHPVLSFGNINKRSFEAIWNSKKYKNFRKDVVRCKGPEFCQEYCLLREKVLCPK